MNLYVNPGKTLDIQHGISKRQAEKIYDKYFAPYHEDRFNTYRPHVLNQLQNPYHLMDYIKEAAENGLVSLKGHRSVGGMRASIYNAMPYEGVEALVAFMKKFEEEHTEK